MRPDLSALWNWFKNYEFVAIWLEGIALVLILFLDWREYRRQGRDRTEQHEETAAQIRIMQNQADATRENAISAKEGAEASRVNAEAARLNAETAKALLELTISKERGRLRLALKQLDLSLDRFLPHAVEYTIQLYGSTEVRIIESGSEAYIGTAPAPLPSGSFLMMPIGLPEVITPQNPRIQASTFFHPKLVLEKSDVDSINARTAVVHFRGFIKYTDIFERMRETKVQYFWNISDLPNLQGGFWSAWSKCGTEADNEET